jgi:thiamine biosynthesis lipoprotein
MRLSYLFIIVLFAFSSCRQSQLSRISFQGQAQGTYYSIIYFDNKGVDYQHEIDSLLDNYNQSVSLYDTNSVISRINRNDSTVETDENFLLNFKAAIEVAEKTNGAFDFTIGQLVNAWGFGLKNREKVTPELIDSLNETVGYRRVKIAGKKLIKEDSRTLIDFNAIAQGYSVDLVGKFLESKGIKRYLVDIGGEVLTKGRKENNQLWSVGIELPIDDPSPEKREVKALVNIEDMALATSGNYRKFYIMNGVKYSHTINPTTGYPVNHSLLSVSVFAHSAAIADAYATAFMVMGLKKTIDFTIKNPELGIYLIYANEKGELKTYMSEKVNSLISEQK